MWDNRIFIINPKKYEITGYIQVPDMTMESGSTEQMVQYGKCVIVTAGRTKTASSRSIPETDQGGRRTESRHPAHLAGNGQNHKMWTITDGGYEGSPYGCEALLSTASMPRRSP